MSDQFELVGAINPRGKAPSICVPAFGSRTSNDTFVQLIGIDDRAVDFEVVEESSWEPVAPLAKRRSIQPGSLALYCIVWSDEKPDCDIGQIDEIRQSLLERRWLIDCIENPFEQLDFAQLSRYQTWFSEVAQKCEAFFKSRDEVQSWLRYSLVLGRLRSTFYALALSKNAPVSLRRKMEAAITVDEKGTDNLSDPDFLKKGPIFNSEDIEAIKRQLENDVAYNYGRSRLSGASDGKLKPAETVSRQWTKRITVSDAQRKRAGNQRGSITLTKSSHPIDQATYFRNELFDNAEWIPGKSRSGETLQTALVRFSTNVLGQNLGVLSIPVSFAANRQARQGNYTSLLHLGPLAPWFEGQDMTNKWLVLERDNNGAFSLTIQENQPTV